MTSDRPARHIAFPLLAATAIGMGAVILVDGDDGVRLPIYSKVSLLPWQGWATWVLTAGLVLTVSLLTEHRAPRTAHTLAVTSLGALVAWWALRWALLAYGSVETGPPHAGAVSYLLIVGVHVMALLLEVWPTIEKTLDARAARRARRRG